MGRNDKTGVYLKRRTEAQWRDNVESTGQFGADWQIITTFNEWGEGTAIEGARCDARTGQDSDAIDSREWTIRGRCGYYIEVLHETP